MCYFLLDKVIEYLKRWIVSAKLFGVVPHVTQGCYLIKWQGALGIISDYFATTFGWLKVCYFFFLTKKVTIKVKAV